MMFIQYCRWTLPLVHNAVNGGTRRTYNRLRWSRDGCCASHSSDSYSLVPCAPVHTSLSTDLSMPCWRLIHIMPKPSPALAVLAAAFGCMALYVQSDHSHSPLGALMFTRRRALSRLNAPGREEGEQGDDDECARARRVDCGREVCLTSSPGPSVRHIRTAAGAGRFHFTWSSFFWGRCHVGAGMEVGRDNALQNKPRADAN